MRIFSLGNTKHVGFWAAAPNEETAARVALAAGHIKSLKGLRNLKDSTEHFAGMDPTHHDIATVQVILNGDVTGRVFGQGKSYSIHEIMEQAQARLRGETVVLTKTTWHVEPIAPVEA